MARNTTANEVTAAVTAAKTAPPTAPPAPPKERWVMQHVWKCGGTELCQLARANEWHVPPWTVAPGCTIHRVNLGADGDRADEVRWPGADYKMVGNERPVPSGYVNEHYRWMTALRHPLTRSLSHYHHMKRVAYKKWAPRNYSKREFFTEDNVTGFDLFVPNQQTRWHCGTRDCNGAPFLNRSHLEKAMSNLDKFEVVLITDDLPDPDSCTRVQMRHILNWTVGDLREKSVRERYKSSTDWIRSVRPHLDRSGTSGIPELEMETPVVAAALGIQNDMDLQLYGYAQRLCEERAKAATLQLSSATLSPLGVESDSSQSGFPSSPPTIIVLCWFVCCFLLLLIRCRHVGKGISHGN